eukprot:999006-Amorphochlora_amoeboformis.AAC.1
MRLSHRVEVWDEAKTEGGGLESDIWSRLGIRDKTRGGGLGIGYRGWLGTVDALLIRIRKSPEVVIRFTWTQLTLPLARLEVKGFGL